MKPLSRADLDLITARTIDYYERNAVSFWAGTCDHDVTQNYEAFFGALPVRPGLKLLDFGCGPGRDLAYFKGLGHEAVGLEGTPAFCEMARAHSGCEVWNQNFLALQLPPAGFDGIFANASLFHVPRQELTRVLSELAEALVPGGVLFSSNPRGVGQEGWSGDRYGTYLEWDEYQTYLDSAGFAPLKHYFRPPGLPLEDQHILAVVSRKKRNHSVNVARYARGI